MDRSPAGRYWKHFSLVAAAVTGGALLLAMAPPFVGTAVGDAVMRAYSFVCHQLPDRSPALNGVQLAICHRCLGIYAGLVAASFAYPLLLRWDRKLMRFAAPIIVASLVVPGVDWLGGLLGLWVNSPASRIATGFVFGFTAGYYFVRAVSEIVRQYRTSDTVAHTI